MSLFFLPDSSFWYWYPNDNVSTTRFDRHLTLNPNSYTETPMRERERGGEGEREREKCNNIHVH